MEIKEIEKRLHELNEQEWKIRAEGYELRKQLIDYQKEKLKPLVGMTFKVGEDYVVINDVPQERLIKVGTDFNAYQLPVIMIGKKDVDGIGIYKDTIFSRAVDSDDPVWKIRKEYEEISSIEFRAKLEMALWNIRDATKLYDMEKDL
jgi:hypothetical protein